MVYNELSKFIQKESIMKCPICGAWCFVLSTRKGIIRRRECANGHRFTTIETVKLNKTINLKRRKGDV